jgi:hypothetical protein
MSGLIVNDVSAHQGAIDWPAHRAGRQAVILRAHNGHTADARWHENRAGAHPLRLVGIYQYLVADRDPVAQAHDFIETIGDLAPNEWPILDIEEGSNFATRARAWLAVVEAALGRQAWVYAGDNLWQTTDLAKAVGQRPRWVARYSSAHQPVAAWSLWQRASDAHALGVAGFVDESYFPGDIEHLVNLAIGDTEDMPLTDADLDAVQARVRKELDRAPMPGSGFASAMVKLGRSEGYARTVDVESLATELAAHLPEVSAEQVREALGKVTATTTLEVSE